MNHPARSQRNDGRGHWPVGKHRSGLTPAQRADVIRRLRKQLAGVSA